MENVVTLAGTVCAGWVTLGIVDCAQAGAAAVTAASRGMMRRNSDLRIGWVGGVARALFSMRPADTTAQLIELSVKLSSRAETIQIPWVHRDMDFEQKIKGVGSRVWELAFPTPRSPLPTPPKKRPLLRGASGERR